MDSIPILSHNFLVGACTGLYKLVEALKVESLQEKQAMSDFPQVWFNFARQALIGSLRIICMIRSSFIYFPNMAQDRERAFVCCCCCHRLTTTTTFPRLCCVQRPKQSSGLAVLPDKCLELICKSCSKLWSPYGFRILRFGKNGTLVSLLASGKAQKGRKFFVILLMYLSACS